MSWLVIEGFTVQVAEGTEWEDEQFGDIAPSFNNTMRSDIRSHQIGKRVQTVELDADDALVLRLILRSPGSLRCSGDWVEENFGTDEMGLHRVGAVRVRPLGDATSSILQFALRQSQGAVASPLLFSFDGDAPGDYEFTRTGTAMSVDSDGNAFSVAENGFRMPYLYPSLPTVRGGLLERARTNPVLHSRDLTNAAWVKTNVTPLKDQAGIDGAASSASRITATAANGTCLQAVTLASSDRFQSAYVKRLVGSGTIQMTMDNGATWTTVTTTTSWTRVVIPVQTLANPTVGFRIVTSGDSIAVDFVQNENGIEPTSPIATTTLAVTRNDETWYSDYLHAPQLHSGYIRFVEGMSPWALLGMPSSWGASYRLIQIGDAASNAPRFIVHRETGTGRYVASWNVGGTTVSSPVDLDPTREDDIELFWWQYADGSVQIAGRKNSGSITTGAQSGALALTDSYSGPRLYLSHPAEYGIAHFRSVRMVQGTRTETDLLNFAKARLHPRLAA